jgi:DNA-binding MarR family transcriptional regulator
MARAAEPAPGASGTPGTQPADRDDAFVSELNELLVSTFHSIDRYEEMSLRSFKDLGLSTNEAHVVDMVGRTTREQPGGPTVSALAEALGVRVPTATTAVNRLVEKGFLVKERNEADRRVYHVRLTKEGRRAFRLHDLFHRRMVDAVASDLSADERQILANGIRKLKSFFEDAANGDPNPRPVGHNGRERSARGPEPQTVY